jgi:hypothetical protein
LRKERPHRYKIKTQVAEDSENYKPTGKRGRGKQRKTGIRVWRPVQASKCLLFESKILFSF